MRKSRSAIRGSRHERSAIAVRGFLPLLVAGMCWHWARWGIAFLSAFWVNDVTDSPRMVQLTGTTMWAPLLFGGAMGGVFADRFDRLRTIQWQLALLIPMVLLVGLLEVSEQLSVWMIYPFLLFAGVGWVGDMTSRRALVFEIVGTQRLDNAMAYEAFTLASGVAVGNLIGGSVAQRFGIGEAFFVVSALLLIGFLSLHWVPNSSPVEPAPANTGSSTSEELKAGLALVRTNRGLLSILGVTFLANFFLFSYFPAVQRIGDRIGASPSQIGLIAAMTGFGMMTGSFIIGMWEPRHRGIAYIGGVAFGMVMLMPFATSNSVPMAAGALFVAATGSGFFAATQSTLVLTTVDRDMRGRAMGLLSMAIGALPIGTLLLGEIAERVGAPAAVVLMASSGLVLLFLWVSTHQEVLTMGRSADAEIAN
ncbi:MAG: MFS transporter [Actinomycetota bacterium]|nr:MFS transporter [Actinomycetota bacterium]